MQALYAWDSNGQAATPDLLHFGWYDKSHGAEAADLAADELFFARHLVQGTLDHLAEIDALIKGQAVHWEFQRINRVDLAILRVGAFSLLQVRDIAPSITIDEAVSIAKEYSGAESYRFVNGVLDGIRKKIGV